MNANGSLHSRVLRVVLRSHLNEMQKPLHRVVSNKFDEEFRIAKGVQGERKQIQSFAMAKRLITAANSLVFFGERLCQDPVFLEAALDYPEDLLKTAEVLRFVPSILAPYAAPILMRQHKASKVLVDYLTPLIEERLKQRDEPQTDPSHPKSVDCIQFFVDSDQKRQSWSAQKILQVLLGIWFAAVHQPALSLVYALDDLCNNPEYIDLLRDEIHTCDAAQGDINSLPLLDSFLRESARLHPSDSISVRRKVLTPFTFSDGTQLAAGEVACVPLQAIMRDPSNYPDSLKFDPFRFMDQKRSGNLLRFVDTSPTYPLWGLGKRAW